MSGEIPPPGGMYLVWSHEHGAWWGPGFNGYVRHLSMAGRYTRAEALRICAQAMPGTAREMGALPELPVRLADIEAMRAAYREAYPHLGTEPWE